METVLPLKKMTENHFVNWFSDDKSLMIKNDFVDGGQRVNKGSEMFLTVY